MSPLRRCGALGALAGLLLTAHGCSTAAPTAGQLRASYDRYGVRVLQVHARVIAAPARATDDEQRLRVATPALLGPEDAIEPAAPQGAPLAAQLTQQLIAALQRRGFVATTATVPDALAPWRAQAGASGADAVLLQRCVWVQRLDATRWLAGETRAGSINRNLESAAPVRRERVEAVPLAGQLLLCQLQLLDAPTGQLLYRGETAPVPTGERLALDAPLLDWGVLAPAGQPVASDAANRAVQLAVQRGLGTLRPAALPRQLDEPAARSLARREPREQQVGWQLGALAGTAALRFPARFELGPLDPATPTSAQHATLVHDDLATALGAALAVEVGYRWQRLRLAARLSDRYLPAVSRRSYLRSDAGGDRLFPLELGPSHDLGLELQLGHQRLLTPWLGLRCGAGPLLRWHLIGGSQPAGTRLDTLNLALGLAVHVEPVVLLGDLELGLRLQPALGYDLAGGIYGGGELALRAAWNF